LGQLAFPDLHLATPGRVTVPGRVAEPAVFLALPVHPAPPNRLIRAVTTQSATRLDRHRCTASDWRYRHPRLPNGAPDESATSPSSPGNQGRRCHSSATLRQTPD